MHLCVIQFHLPVQYNVSMRKVLRFLKKIWLLNFLRRIYRAGKLPLRKSVQILKWGIRSNEDTNYTYYLTPTNITYLAHTIAVVMGVSPAIVLEYIHEAREDKDLRESILTSIKHSNFKHTADREVRFGRRLGWYAVARILKPKTIVETGVDKGLGAVLLCAALLKNKAEGFPGRYYGTDINPEAGYMLAGKYKQTGEILYGDSIESLSRFTEPIELFINDSDHSVDYEYNEYKTIERLINERTIILGDNAHYTDKLALFSNKLNRKFLYFQEVPLDHWYPGGGIGISYT